MQAFVSLAAFVVVSFSVGFVSSVLSRPPQSTQKAAVDAELAMKPQPDYQLPAVQCMGAYSATAACLTIDGDIEVEDFMTRDCQWHEAGDRLYVAYVQSSMKEDDVSYSPGESKKREYCVSGDWMAFRIGPFVTTGGYSWNGMAAVINSSYLPYRGPDGVYAFSHQVVGNIDESNQLLGYPPIHQHHYHFEGGLGIGSPGYLNNHGDNQCHANEGGVRCLNHVAPKGTAFVLGATINLATEFNDVRNLNNPPLTSYIFAAFKTVEPTTIRQLTQHVATLYDDARAAPRYTYEIRPKIESVVWGYERLTFDLNEVVEAYMHSHATVMEDLWVFQGEPEEVFSNVSAMGPQLSARYSEGVIQATGNNIRQRMLQPNPARLSCSYMTASRVEHICDDSVCTDFYRKSRCSLDPSVKGLTMIAMHKTVPTIEKYNLHNLLRIFYKLPKGEFVKNKDVMDMESFARLWSNHLDPKIIGIDGLYLIYSDAGV